MKPSPYRFEPNHDSLVLKLNQLEVLLIRFLDSHPIVMNAALEILKQIRKEIIQ